MQVRGSSGLPAAPLKREQHEGPDYVASFVAKTNVEGLGGYACKGPGILVSSLFPSDRLSGIRQKPGSQTEGTGQGPGQAGRSPVQASKANAT